MLKQLIVSNIGNQGLNTDLNKSELPPEFITSGLNFRVNANTIESMPSSAVLSVPPAHFNGGHVRFVKVGGSGFWMVLGRTAIYVFNGSTWFDITSVAGYGGVGVDGELQWSSTLLGRIPIVNNIQHVPEYWSPQSGSQVMQPLLFSAGNTWAAVNKSFKVIRSHNNFLFALNLVESGVELPNSYRWSHPADNNALPFTWDETDPSGLASIEQILGDSGAIVDGLSLRASFVIYSERGINILNFTGDEFVFNNQELTSSYGLISSETIVEIESRHYFLSDGDILVNDGNAVTSIAHNRIRRRLNARINAAFYDRSFVIANKANKEIWFCVPEDASEYANVAYIYNWVDDTWAIKQLANNIAYTDYGTLVTPSVTWNTVQGTWDTIKISWGSSVKTPLNETVVGVSVIDSSLVVLNPLNNTSGVDLNSRIERTDYPLESHRQVTTLTQVIPHMRGSGDVNIQIGSQQYAGAPVNWEPVTTYNPATDRKIDIRSTGLLHAWRIDSVGKGQWSLSGMTFSYALAGER